MRATRFSSVPAAFVERLTSILVWCVDGWRLALGVLILAAALHATGVERAGVATIGLMLLAYLTFAHPPMWIVYYLEVLPICLLPRRTRDGSPAPQAQRRGARSQQRPLAGAGGQCLPGSCAPVAAARSERRAPRPRGDRSSKLFHRAAEAAIATLPPEKSIVFVSYPPSQSPHVALTRNEPDLASALRWVVYDRGPQNAELRALAPDRVAYRLDAATMRIERMP